MARRIKRNKYYILNIEDLSKPYLLNFRFDPKEGAKRYIRDNLTVTDAIRPIKGSRAIKIGVDFLFFKNTKLNIKPRKYKFPPDVITQQQKKNFRNKVRYHFWGTYPEGHQYSQSELRKFLE